MLGSERQNEIINYLRIHGSASVKKLTGIVFASEATVRRDLNELEKIYFEAVNFEKNDEILEKKIKGTEYLLSFNK